MPYDYVGEALGEIAKTGVPDKIPAKLLPSSLDAVPDANAGEVPPIPAAGVPVTDYVGEILNEGSKFKPDGVINTFGDKDYEEIVKSNDPKYKTKGFMAAKIGPEPLSFDEVKKLKLKERSIEELNAAYTKTIGEPVDVSTGLPNATLRADLSFSDKTSEKLKKLRANGYEAKVLDDNGTPTIFWKKNEEDPWRPVDAPRTNELADVGDYASGAITAGVGAAGTLVGQPEAGLVARAGLQGLINAGANAFGQLVEKVRGFQDSSVKDMAVDNLLEFGAGAAGEAGASAITAPVNKLRTTGFGPSGKMTREVVGIADNRGFEPPTLGQSSQLFARAENQLAEKSNVIKDYYQTQRDTFANKIKDFFSADSKAAQDASESDLKNILTTQKNDILKQAENPNITPEQASINLMEGYREAVNNQNDVHSAMYKKAMDASKGDVTFDLTPTKQVVVNNPTMLKMEAMPEEKTMYSVTDYMGGTKFYTQAQAEAKFGKDKIPDYLDKENITVDGEPVSFALVSPDVRALGAKITKLASEVGEFDGRSGYEQLRLLRQQARDLAEPSRLSGKPTYSEKLAGDIEQSLTQVIKNPSGGGEEFINAWKAADKQYATDLSWRETKAIRNLRDSEEMGKLVDNVLQTGNITQLRGLKENLPAERYSQIQDYFKSRLLNNPDKITELMDNYAYQPEQLHLLMKPEEVAQFKSMGENIDKLNHSGIANLLKYNGNMSRKMAEFIGESQPNIEEIKNAVDIGGENFRGLAKAAVVRRILDVPVTVNGAQSVDLNKVVTNINKFEHSGLLDAVGFSKDEINFLKDARTYGSFITEKADSGSSLAVSSVMAKVLSPFLAAADPKEWIYSVFELGMSGKFSKMWLSNATQKAAFGAGKEPINTLPVRQTMNALSAYTADALEKENKYKAGDFDVVRDLFQRLEDNPKLKKAPLSSGQDIQPKETSSSPKLPKMNIQIQQD